MPEPSSPHQSVLPESIRASIAGAALMEKAAVDILSGATRNERDRLLMLSLLGLLIAAGYDGAAPSKITLFGIDLSVKTGWIFPSGLCFVIAYLATSFSIMHFTDGRRWKALRLFHGQQLLEVIFAIRQAFLDSEERTYELAGLLEKIRPGPNATYDDVMSTQKEWNAIFENLKANDIENERLSHLLNNACVPISSLATIQKIQLAVNFAAPLLLSALSVISLVTSLMIRG
ncbi:hypothetical protein [Azospirillum sp. Marseille-Q6669]